MGDRTHRRAFLTAIGTAATLTAGCFSRTEPSRGGTSRTDETELAQKTIVPAEQQPASELADQPETATRPFAKPPDESVVLDTFDTFADQWEVVSGQAAPTSETAFVGGQSVRLDATGTRRVEIRRRFDTPRDFTDRDFSFAVRLRETGSAGLLPYLIVRDVYGNYRRYGAALSPLATDRWTRMDVGVVEDQGVDTTAVSSIAIGEYTGGTQSVFLVDDVQTRPKPEVGQLVFSFDDASSRDYTLAYPVLEEYGFDGTCFPPSALLDADGEPSLSAYREMHRAGWDVGAHTPLHEYLPDKPRETQRRLLEKNIAQLRQRGFTEGLEHFRTTQGAYDAHTLDLLRSLFQTSIVPQGKATGSPARVTDPSMIGYKSGDDYEQAKAYIDAAVNYRQLVGLTIHMRNADDPQAFRSLIDHAASYVDRGALQVLSHSDYYERFVQPAR